MSLEPQKHTKRMEINQSQTMTFWTLQVLFPKRSAKMIDCSKKCKCQLAFKLQNLHVFEKCGNTLLRHWDCFLSPVTINDKDRHGLKVEKLGPTFSIFNPMTAEMTQKYYGLCSLQTKLAWYMYLLPNSTGQTFGVKALSNDLSIEVT